MILGKKTILRAVEEKDLETLLHWRNLESFRVNFREFRELNMLEQKKWFERTTSSPNDFMFSILDKKERLIGACGLLYIDWIIRSADFSFYIGKDESYVDGLHSKDAALCLINYGFGVLNLNKIWMELYEYDQKKINFFTKNFGFQEDGKLRQNCYSIGSYHDSLIISLLKKDFNG